MRVVSLVFIGGIVANFQGSTLEFTLASVMASHHSPANL